MDVKSVIAEVGTWSVEDRFRLMDALWADLVDQGHARGLSDEQREEIRHRIEEDDADPDDVVSWEEVKAELLKRAGR
ncbi:MAG TPA: addiction module protein [Isosphaeraceae bacterium]|nr:addiction module protein [Isosphaeraceae bacterium]